MAKLVQQRRHAGHRASEALVQARQHQLDAADARAVTATADATVRLIGCPGRIQPDPGARRQQTFENVLAEVEDLDDLPGHQVGGVARQIYLSHCSTLVLVEQPQVELARRRGRACLEIVDGGRFQRSEQREVTAHRRGATGRKKHQRSQLRSVGSTHALPIVMRRIAQRASVYYGTLIIFDERLGRQVRRTDLEPRDGLSHRLVPVVGKPDHDCSFAPGRDRGTLIEVSYHIVTCSKEYTSIQ